MNELPALIEPSWLAARLDAVRVVEIAGIGQDDQTAFRAGHIRGAVCWNWKPMLWDSHIRDFPSPQVFAQRLGAAGIGDDTTVVVYGEPMQFGIYAWWVLRYCGHERVCVLDGGRRRWVADGHPLVIETVTGTVTETATETVTESVTEAVAVTSPPAAPVTAVHTHTARNEHMRAGRDEVLAAIGEARTLILDARSAPEYRGERVGAPGAQDVGAVRYGRIPGARHLEYLELLGANERFRPEAELRALFGARGVRAQDPVIAYCRMSHRATVLYFAMTALLGYENARVYDGSWTEWGSMVGVPVER